MIKSRKRLSSVKKIKSHKGGKHRLRDLKRKISDWRRHRQLDKNIRRNLVRKPSRLRKLLTKLRRIGKREKKNNKKKVLNTPINYSTRNGNPLGTYYVSHKPIKPEIQETHFPRIRNSPRKVSPTNTRKLRRSLRKSPAYEGW